MPELPDVEVYRRRLVDATRRRRVDGVTVHDTQVLRGVGRRRLDSALSGARFVRTRRRGKTLYAVTSHGPHLRLHFGMTGDLVVRDDDEEVPAHTRVALRLSGGRRLLFVDQRRFGQVGVVDDVDDDIAAHDLGPDALDLDPAALGELLHGSSAGLKALLVDQSQVAGLGNIYTDEVLFHARLDPRSPAADVGNAGVRRLHRQLHRVLDRAVAAGADPRSMPRGWLIHRRTEDAECPRGNGPIRSFPVGGRRGYWCPACQDGRG
ncbi:MAG TPA: DNA-formamidopyrimidine glycosylase family protein [Nocardioides sp.]|uniref:Fpg/Nei family DNA glycosylase n=1 Tax=Nocardioides sp. TaxID=35761 RepID=UPI002F411DA1